MMTRIIAMAAAALALGTAWAQAQGVKVGVALPYTGIGAEFAQVVHPGLELHLTHNAVQVNTCKTAAKRLFSGLSRSAW